MEKKLREDNKDIHFMSVFYFYYQHFNLNSTSVSLNITFIFNTFNVI